MTLFAVHRRRMKNWALGTPIREQSLWSEHAEYIDRIFDAGKIVLGGPYTDGSGALLIISVENEQEARRLFEDDPWVAAEIFDVGTITPWQVFMNGLDKPELRNALKVKP